MKLKEEKKELIEEETKKEVNKRRISKRNKKIFRRNLNEIKRFKRTWNRRRWNIILKDKDKDKNLINNPLNLKDSNNGGNNTINNNITNTKNKKESISEDSYLLNEKYSFEQNIYDTLRLNKSLDAENINKDTLKFDIEFMYRCLALALMKHIE